MAPIGNPSLFYRFFGLVSVSVRAAGAIQCPCSRLGSKTPDVHEVISSPACVVPPARSLVPAAAVPVVSASAHPQTTAIRPVHALVRLCGLGVVVLELLLFCCSSDFCCWFCCCSCTSTTLTTQQQVENYPLYAMVGIACGLAVYTPIRHLTQAADIA